jgi:hypothetical protein
VGKKDVRKKQQKTKVLCATFYLSFAICSGVWPCPEMFVSLTVAMLVRSRLLVFRDIPPPFFLLFMFSPFSYAVYPFVHEGVD